MLSPIALTAGEPAGIGPDLCLAIASEAREVPLVCLADAELLAARAALLGQDCVLEPYCAGVPATRAAGTLCVLHLPLAAPCQPGRPDPRNAGQVLALLDRACDGSLGGEFAAMVTAPVHKGVINDAGRPFTGHTEYLAARLGTSHPLMLLVAGDLRVALATTHLPLRRVADAITTPMLIEALQLLAAGLRRYWSIASPRIAVCGLNPHAGEGGHLGAEDGLVIAPAVAAAKAQGIEAVGPLPADTLFVPDRVRTFDAVLAMYHDQGLPVLKHVGFGHAVNVTLGLPIVRTSVDHGTALDLAGSGRADAGSLQAAIRLAAGLAAGTA